MRLDGDALDAYLTRLESGYEAGADRLLSESGHDTSRIHRLRGAAEATGALRHQLIQFKIPTRQRQAQPTKKDDPE